MRTVALVLLACSAAAAAPSEPIRIPIQVDQQGKTMYLVMHEDSDVDDEIARFCRAHLKGMDPQECHQSLLEQVNIVRGIRSDAQESLPGITFAVGTPSGKAWFTHEQGANPRHEAYNFCMEHFAPADGSDNVDQCVDAMMQSAQRALEEAQAKAEL
jgi:hypothetical protein